MELIICSLACEFQEKWSSCFYYLQRHSCPQTNKCCHNSV